MVCCLCDVSSCVSTVERDCAMAAVSVVTWQSSDSSCTGCVSPTRGCSLVVDRVRAVCDGSSVTWRGGSSLAAVVGCVLSSVKCSLCALP